LRGKRSGGHVDDRFTPVSQATAARRMKGQHLKKRSSSVPQHNGRFQHQIMCAAENGHGAAENGHGAAETCSRSCLVYIVIGCYTGAAWVFHEHLLPVAAHCRLSRLHTLQPVPTPTRQTLSDTVGKGRLSEKVDCRRTFVTSIQLRAPTPLHITTLESPRLLTWHDAWLVDSSVAMSLGQALHGPLDLGQALDKPWTSLGRPLGPWTSLGRPLGRSLGP
jgi:hypothetical protein